MAGRERGKRRACDESPEEKFFPVSRIGLIIFLVGLALVFISLVVGFWLAFLGAVLILIGWLVIANC